MPSAILYSIVILRITYMAIRERNDKFYFTKPDRGGPQLWPRSFILISINRDREADRPAG